MIFNGTSTTETQIVVGVGEHDYGLRNLGMLALRENTITSPTPFAAPFSHISGVDCELIYGDVWQQIGTVGLPGTTGGRLGPPSSSLVGVYQAPRLTTDVRGNETHKVTGDRNVAVNGNARFTVQNFDQPPGLGDPPNLGSYTETFYGPVNRTFFQTVTESYHDDKHVNQKDDSHLEHKKCEIESVGLAIGITGIQIDVNNYIHLDIGTVHVEGKAIGVEGAIIAVGGKLIEKDETLFCSESRAMEQKIKGIEKQVTALEHKTGISVNVVLRLGNPVCPVPPSPFPDVPIPIPPNMA